MRFKLKALYLHIYLASAGLALGAVAAELDDAGVAALPEFQRGYYVKDPATGKHKVDLSKIELEDVSGLKGSLETTRKERDAAKRAADERVKDALKQFEGIDPVKTRALLAKFNDADEAALIAAGNIDEVVKRRSEKFQTEMESKLEEANRGREGALEVATTFMEKVLDNAVRSAVADKVHASALKNGDILRAAREIFSLDDNGNAVQFEEDGETIVMGKDNKTPFTVEEWIETCRETSPHWFPAAGSGGGGPGSNNQHGGKKSYEGLSSTEKLKQAREDGIKS